MPADLAPRATSAMPRTISEMVGSSTLELDGLGVQVGSRNGVDEKGRLRPLHPRPWHSYRTARRNISRHFFQKTCRRRIDPAANLAHLAEAAQLRGLIDRAIEQRALREQSIEAAELERMKATKTF
jgi:hypothetical protein